MECKEIVIALFGYELGDSNIVGGKYVFPYAGGVTPKVSDRDISFLGNNAFSIKYSVKAEGVNGEYIINNQVTLNVIRQNNKYSKFLITSIVSADG